jgi:hypothetical protein
LAIPNVGYNGRTRSKVGRVLLAGDCAHLMSPFGARGLWHRRQRPGNCTPSSRSTAGSAAQAAMCTPRSCCAYSGADFARKKIAIRWQVRGRTRCPPRTRPWPGPGRTRGSPGIPRPAYSAMTRPPVRTGRIRSSLSSSPDHLAIWSAPQHPSRSALLASAMILGSDCFHARSGHAMQQVACPGFTERSQLCGRLLYPAAKQAGRATQAPPNLFHGERLRWPDRAGLSTTDEFLMHSQTAPDPRRSSTDAR